MANVRTVTGSFAVAPQIRVEDVAELGKAGFTTLINNRPDGESPDQPSGSEIAAAAAAAGLAYVAIPVRGGPTAEQAQAMRAALQNAHGPVLAFCRSGTRSITAWAIGAVAAGEDRASVLASGRAAGYDLSGAV
jgi:uncharacterized protein (TIGR01244 family)